MNKINLSVNIIVIANQFGKYVETCKHFRYNKLQYHQYECKHRIYYNL